MNNGYSKLLVVFAAFLAVSTAGADEAAEMAQMQAQLNAEVMSQPFDAGDPAKIDAYIEEAMKNDIKPVSKAPGYWQPGYTCDYIRRYRYNYNNYRNCMYHHRYYGRYW